MKSRMLLNLIKIYVQKHIVNITTNDKKKKKNISLKSRMIQACWKI